MSHQILTPDEMNEADRLTIQAGTSGYRLMLAAGRAVAREALSRFPQAHRIAVLAGPGNNGGDGYVAASILRDGGADVTVHADEVPRPGSGAAKAATAWNGPTATFQAFRPDKDTLVVDALYGAGLNRALESRDLELVARVRESECKVLAVDLPSGISGYCGAVLGDAIRADCTVTFFRKKPGHLLYPGRGHCGTLAVADIGIPDTILEPIGCSAMENHPSCWERDLPWPDATAHKYSRGHVAVLSGGPAATGAARLSVEAAARAGAGAVTLLSPPSAMLVNASHLTAAMLKAVSQPEEVQAFLVDRKARAVVCGPGFGTSEKQMAVLRALLMPAQASPALVLDADALTLCASDGRLLDDRPDGGDLVLTPHEGEFARLFPDLSKNESLSKLDRARQAAASVRGVVIYKGADTVIAAPDGRAAINGNGCPWLATAGSGDVLSGVVAALLAQGMPPFEAACAAVWVHAEAGNAEGFGLTAEDLPRAVRRVLTAFMARAPSARP